MPTHVDALLRADRDAGGGSGGTAGPVRANMKATRRRLALAASILAGFTSFGTVLAQDFNAVIPDFYSEPGFVPHREYSNDQAAESIDIFGGGLQFEGSP